MIVAALSERVRLVARGDGGRTRPARSDGVALTEGGVGDPAVTGPALSCRRDPVRPSVSADIPESCFFCGEVVKVVDRFPEGDERLIPFGARGSSDWLRMTCLCGTVELLVRAEEIS